MKPATKVGLHGWYVTGACGEMVDGPYFTKGEAEESLLYHLDVWKAYFKPGDLAVKAEARVLSGRPKGERSWKHVLR